MSKSKRTLAERFWPKVDKHGPPSEHRPDLGPCWLWIAAIDRKGYGAFGGPRDRTQVVRAHRVAYELVIGPIPDGLTLDHLCRVRRCVNPEHLEPVTGRENSLRGESVAAVNARKTHCIRGHEFTPENTKIQAQGRQRACRICWRENARRRRAGR